MKRLMLLSIAALWFCSCMGVNVCKIRPELCVPPTPPPVTEPSPPPVTVPPVTSPTPVPTAPPTAPPVVCTPPPGEAVILINDPRDPISMGLANQFLKHIYADYQGHAGLGEQIAREVESMTGCSRYSDCMVEEPQKFFARLNTRLQQKGLCAGQFEPGRQDGITIAESKANTPSWAESLWVTVHVINYGGPKVAWGKIIMRQGDIPQGNESSEWAVWQETDPESPPSPGPTPLPTPTPGNPDQVWTASIKASEPAVRGPAAVEIVCVPKSKDGRVLATPASLIFVGAQLGGAIKGTHFSVSKRDLSATLQVKAGCPAGVIKANCAWYSEDNFGKGVTTPNVSIQVTQ